MNKEQLHTEHTATFETHDPREGSDYHFQRNIDGNDIFSDEEARIYAQQLGAVLRDIPDESIQHLLDHYTPDQEAYHD